MGCDIHLVLEKRHGTKWVAVDTFSYHHRQYARPDDRMDGFSSPIARMRNYERFAKLAGVRGDGPDPLGVPEDASETTRALIEEWGGDGHSHSWLPLKDASAIWLATAHKPPESAMKYPDSYFFNVDTSEGSRHDRSNYRVVFWFDN